MSKVNLGRNLPQTTGDSSQYEESKSTAAAAAVAAMPILQQQASQEVLGGINVPDGVHTTRGNSNIVAESNLLPCTVVEQSNNDNNHIMSPVTTSRAASATVTASSSTGGGGKGTPRNRSGPKRQCRFPGCQKTIKSQGHCQRHGAKAKRCKVAGCTKQAQGTHEGMCKRHWKEVYLPQPPPKPEETPPEPTGESVYDFIIPASIGWRIGGKSNAGSFGQQSNNGGTNQRKKTSLLLPDLFTNSDVEQLNDGSSSSTTAQSHPNAQSNTNGKKDINSTSAEDDKNVMPLLKFLRNAKKDQKPAGWHRRDERASRGVKPVAGITAQFEAWERQLAAFEVMLLSGIRANFSRDLAHAWGREKGFHIALCKQICDRRGELDRKKRKDTGTKMSDEQKANFREKLKERKRSRVETSTAAEDDGNEKGSDNRQESDSMVSPPPAATAAAATATTTNHTITGSNTLPEPSPMLDVAMPGLNGGDVVVDGRNMTDSRDISIADVADIAGLDGNTASI